MEERDYERIREAFIADAFGTGDTLYVVGAPLPSFSARRTPSTDEVHHYRRARLPELIDQAKKTASLGAYLRGQAHRAGLASYRATSFEQGQISRDYWSKLLNDEIKPSKEKLLRVAVLLRLNGEQLDEMLEKAGYALSPTDLRDVVVSYCIRERHYDFAVIERLLADHEIRSLFNDRRCSSP